MNPTALLEALPHVIAGVQAGEDLLDFVSDQIALADQDGRFTAAQREQIRRRAKEIDERFDDRIAAAQERLAE